IFYPAITWPHKNHIALLKALAVLREKGTIIPLVASGHQQEFYRTIEQWIRQLHLQDQVRFVGFVDSIELQCLYRLCRGLAFPSKFEGWGLPVTEAFSLGVPVACSNVTSLPEVAGDAALLFDPDQPEQIADAVYKIWTDDTLRATLVQRGKDRSKLFSWDHT